MKIKTAKGLVEVPNGLTVVKLLAEAEKAVDVGVVADRKGVLPPVVVVSGKSVRGLSVAEEEKLVDAAIKDMPLYEEVRAMELPYPSSNASKEEWNRWNASFRLGFFPISLISDVMSDYKLYEGGEHEKKAKCLGGHLRHWITMVFYNGDSWDLP